MSALHFVFDGPPGPEAGRFVEVETPDGHSVNAGEWHERDDGLWELRVRMLTPADREAVARIINPRAWEVMDEYHRQAEKNGLYVNDGRYDHKESLALADAILAAPSR